MEPLGFVTWSHIVAELYPDGTWRCADAGVRDGLMEADLLARYGRPSGRSEDGPFGPAILEHLAHAVHGQWVFWPVQVPGLIR